MPEYIRKEDALACFSPTADKDGEILSDAWDDPVYQKIEALEGTEVNAEYICRKLGEWFDPPCSYGLGDIEDVAEFMADAGDGQWCNNNCGDEDRYYWCWLRFFGLLKEKEDGEDQL